MKFLASLIVLYFVFRLVSYVFIRILSYKVRKATGMNQKDFEETQQAASAQKKKKIFQEDAGDYVDFEEIKKGKD